MQLPLGETRHQAFIAGLIKLYALLLDIGYVSDQDVHMPPHASPRLEPSKWLNVGFSEQVVNLLPQIPFMEDSS
jgi:hypothetical protein